MMSMHFLRFFLKTSHKANVLNEKEQVGFKKLELPGRSPGYPHMRRDFICLCNFSSCFHLGVGRLSLLGLALSHMWNEGTAEG